MVVDRVNLTLVEPFNSLAIFPETEFDLAVLGNKIGTQAVLFSLVPVSLVAAPVRPSVYSKAMLLVIFVLALVHPTIVPDVNAHALHVVVEPFTLVFTAIEP